MLHWHGGRGARQQATRYLPCIVLGDEGSGGSCVELKVKGAVCKRYLLCIMSLHPLDLPCGCLQLIAQCVWPSLGGWRGGAMHSLTSMHFLHTQAWHRCCKHGWSRLLRKVSGCSWIRLSGRAFFNSASGYMQPKSYADLMCTTSQGMSA